MEEKLQIDSKVFVLERYPVTTDKSLRAWSNAELLALDFIADKNIDNIHLFNDRFGVWNCVLHDKKLTTVWTYASQQKAICKNLERNNLSADVVFKTPLDALNKVNVALIKIPKSLELFELFLQQIYKSSHEETEVVCGFMLKYFSPSFLKIASIYFEEVEQSKAWKKARLLVLKKPKKAPSSILRLTEELINTLEFKGKELKQYYGVFSSGSIDIGTQFFLENLKVFPQETKVLDLASGNGVIAYQVTELNSKAEVTLVDDFNLAIESSKINLKDRKAKFLCAENLSSLHNQNFDLVVSNPPFHFEYENNIEVTLSLFEDVKACLKNNGRFLLVANTHLNYKTHLNKLFTEVTVVNFNKKFEIIECIK
ncbi:16S rRNA G1207 methylase RsmC [Tenacibaculum adriaticum]|uniref:16S rRNA G1207 methylase RsmC n=1 Tax=Tenacibaculum adriaticum TaxID=413713 RepID=A0A5S5DNP2_9FLAO|nr:methyltransferase [Tenacibaculum adriaticum]TYP97570.1 16S rRNA G1207 methylase RsmC [Tenacibaculum adriaticum]